MPGSVKLWDGAWAELVSQRGQFRNSKEGPSSASTSKLKSNPSRIGPEHFGQQDLAGHHIDGEVANDLAQGNPVSIVVLPELGDDDAHHMRPRWSVAVRVPVAGRWT